MCPTNSPQARRELLNTANHNNRPDPTLLAMRRPSNPGDMYLTPEAEALMASLHESLRPTELAARFPRIVNKMAQMWKRPIHLDRYFDELLIDSRGQRQGFPLKVLLELTSLKQHYQTSTFPTPYSVWDDAHDDRHR
jgi:hypothetical protein